MPEVAHERLVEEEHAVEEAPSQEEIDAYLESEAEKNGWNETLAILEEEPFNCAGPKAESEGWFVGKRATLQAVVATEIAGSLGLTPEETHLLVQSALITSASARMVVEARARGEEITVKRMEEIYEEAGAILVARGVDPRAIEIGRASRTSFAVGLAQGERVPTTPAEEETLKLQKLLCYIENSVDSRAPKGPDGTRHHETDIMVDYRDRLTAAKLSHPDTDADKVLIDGELVSPIDVEMSVVGAIENEIKEARAAKNDEEKKLLETTPLWQVIRQKVIQDIEEGK